MPADPAATRRLIESLSTHLEDHLAAWKSALVDARREIENLLGGLSEKIPAHAKPLFPEDVVGMMIDDVAPPAAASPPRAAEGAAPSAADWAIVRGSLAAIESARTQVDVLTRFLNQANSHASRVALLVLRNDRITGWKAIGFDTSGGRDDAVKSLDLAADDDPMASEVLKGQRSLLAEPPDETWPLRRTLGGKAPSRSLLVPMVIRDRLAGLVCAEELPGEEGRLNEAAIEVLTFATGLAVDLLAARKRIPSPSLTPTGEAIRRFGKGAAAPVFETGTPATPPVPAETPPLTSGLRRRVTDASEALRALEESANRHRKEAEAKEAAPKPVPLPSPVPAAPPPRTPSGFSAPLSQASTGDLTMAFEQLKGAGPTPARPVAPPLPPLPEAPKPKPVGPITSQVRPISGFIPRSRAGQAPESPQRALEDARRLARLLVSEIKLYNEKKVEEGRTAGDLYERLKDDIERSRQVYEERTPESIRKGTNFFQEELVRILADGRSEALGSTG